jgi:rare lipoprotein A
MRKLAIWIGTVLAVILLILAVFLGWLLTPAHAAERCGRASWYGGEMCKPGRPCLTADNRHFDPNALSIAMRKKPDGALYRATYGGRSVVVRHNDFGPSDRIKPRRDFDLSRGAAARLGLLSAGVGRICITRLR